MTMQKVIKWYYTNLKFNNWDLYVVVSDQGVTFIGSNHKGFSELEYWQQKKGTNILLVADQGGKTDKVITQLTEYLAGKRTTFILPFDFIGTFCFNKKFDEKLQKYHMGQQLVTQILPKKLAIPAPFVLLELSLEIIQWQLLCRVTVFLARIMLYVVMVVDWKWKHHYYN